MRILPISKDAIDGAALAINLAQIYAWTGEKDLAIEQIATVERIPIYSAMDFSSCILIGTRCEAIRALENCRLARAQAVIVLRLLGSGDAHTRHIQHRFRNPIDTEVPFDQRIFQRGGAKWREAQPSRRRGRTFGKGDRHREAPRDRHEGVDTSTWCAERQRSLKTKRPRFLHTLDSAQ